MFPRAHVRSIARGPRESTSCRCASPAKSRARLIRTRATAVRAAATYPSVFASVPSVCVCVCRVPISARATPSGMRSMSVLDHRQKVAQAVSLTYLYLFARFARALTQARLTGDLRECYIAGKVVKLR